MHRTSPDRVSVGVKGAEAVLEIDIFGNWVGGAKLDVLAGLRGLAAEDHVGAERGQRELECEQTIEPAGSFSRHVDPALRVIRGTDEEGPRMHP